VPIAVAGRYARALADVVEPQGDYRAVERELADFAAAYRASPELREVFETPAVALDGKIKVLDAILARMGASRPASNFLRVLVSHFRLPLLDEIREAFAKIVNDRMGIVEVNVYSASALSQEARQTLRSQFERVTRKQVEMDFQLRENLLGGILAQIRSTVYDGTVRGQLDRIREKLTGR
jgi:F-type H+-transporting ATPase subunit delta